MIDELLKSAARAARHGTSTALVVDDVAESVDLLFAREYAHDAERDDILDFPSFLFAGGTYLHIVDLSGLGRLQEAYPEGHLEVVPATHPV